MLSTVSLLIIGPLIFQAPRPLQVADTSVPSPRAVAEQNPAISDELRGDIMMARKMYLDAIDFYKTQANTNAVLANKTGIAYHQMGDLNSARNTTSEPSSWIRNTPKPSTIWAPFITPTSRTETRSNSMRRPCNSRPNRLPS